MIRLLVIMLLIVLWVLNPIPFVPSKSNIENQNQSIQQTRGTKIKLPAKFQKVFLKNTFRIGRNEWITKIGNSNFCNLAKKNFERQIDLV